MKINAATLQHMRLKITANCRVVMLYQWILLPKLCTLLMLPFKMLRGTSGLAHELITMPVLSLGHLEIERATFEDKDSGHTLEGKIHC